MFLGKKEYFLLAILLLFLSGCSGNIQVFHEEEESSFRRAERLKREGNYEESLYAFLKVIENRRDAPESHLNAGLLLLEHREEPILAIYHFTKYLELKPDSDKSDLVRQRIEVAKKKFIQKLPEHSYTKGYERLDLIEIITQMKSETKKLKQQLLACRQNRTALVSKESFFQNDTNTAENSDQSFRESDTNSSVNTNSTPVSGTLSYSVQIGDTLSKISLKFYNTTARWMDVYRANQDVLKTPNDLKVGQVLRIP
jgi:tetratricopeptide (TPR) repeat protein